MVKVYRDNGLKNSTGTQWTSEFKYGWDTLRDDPRSGRLSEVITDETITQVEKIVMKDLRVKIDEIAVEVGISHIQDHLGMSKVSARCVPSNLSAQNRHQRKESSRELLEVYNGDPANFHICLVTGDETWIHHWDQESMIIQWHSDGLLYDADDNNNR